MVKAKCYTCHSCHYIVLDNTTTISATKNKYMFHLNFTLFDPHLTQFCVKVEVATWPVPKPTHKHADNSPAVLTQRCRLANVPAPALLKTTAQSVLRIPTISSINSCLSSLAARSAVIGPRSRLNRPRRNYRRERPRYHPSQPSESRAFAGQRAR